MFGICSMIENAHFISISKFGYVPLTFNGSVMFVPSLVHQKHDCITVITAIFKADTF